MKKIIKIIPNIFTLLNLFFGCISIIFLQSKLFEYSAFFTIFSLIFDTLDGFLSRYLKIENKFGKELDSLADMVSFGLVPSIIVFLLFKNINGNQKIIPFIEWSSFLIPIFSAWRLAKFNITYHMDNKNYGLTTPVNTIFFTSLSIIMKYKPSKNINIAIKEIVFSPIIIFFMIFFSCYFLITKIPMISFNFYGFSWKRNKKRYLFLLISIFLLLTLHMVAIPCIVILYIITSIYFHRFNRKKLH
ncbi:CDP-diacylglycerol--serine O-phosphatidyltransferase [Blattabacterium sp. (Cryptocercus kyebangensis)]|uniref:CDP-alcohol phosphatidyltransferase family protein n=1 Tax=Blattabacterium sp. (Cryptocercus kyebangensis) TaxID=298656 RepID=UPI000D7CE233|nr:CDP-alcohol phosphatidyltransferase family protein [Blattabacterium sp. (Cryptocercus kyebangensis)]AWU43907.1 CDP-diacylglycerol--serine O-phosphatidyltransferase [Blattabacterium sp. (Cryptocercus kyebangensis)]